MIVLIANWVKTKNMNQIKVAVLPFLKLSTFLNHSNFAAEGNHYSIVIFNHFSKYTVTVSTPTNTAQYAVDSLTQHWISKLGPPDYLITHKGIEYLHSDVAICCTLFSIRHSPKTFHAPWTNGPAEIRNKNLGSHLPVLLDDTPGN